MTGRDLIIYILQNGLEDKSIFEDGRFLGFMTIEETAAKYDVGDSTVIAWILLGYLDSISIGDTIYIPANTKDPRKE